MKLFENQQETKPKIEFLGGVFCAFGTCAWIGFLLNAKTPVIPYLALIPLGLFCAYTYGTLKGDPA
jgi:hypothetical protein